MWLELFRMGAKSKTSKLHIEPEWILRTLNQQADWLSHVEDYDDWAIHSDHFRMLDDIWGPHTVDRFACSYNSHLPRFNSHFWNPGTEAIDAFTCNWSGKVNWLCLLPYLIPRVLRHILNTSARGTLVVPGWPSAPFWPMLFPKIGKVASFVAGLKVLAKS